MCFRWSAFYYCARSTKNLINWAKTERERIYSSVPYPPLFEIVYAKRYWVTSVLHVDSVWFLSLLPSLLQRFRETIFILRHLLRMNYKTMRMGRRRKYSSIVDRFRPTDGCNRPIRRYMQTQGYYSPICPLGTLSWAVCQFHLPGQSHAFTRGQFRQHQWKGVIGLVGLFNPTEGPYQINRVPKSKACSFSNPWMRKFLQRPMCCNQFTHSHEEYFPFRPRYRQNSGRFLIKILTTSL